MMRGLDNVVHYLKQNLTPGMVVGGVLSVGGSAAGLTYLACQSETVVRTTKWEYIHDTRHDDGAGPAVDNEGTALHVFKLKDDYYQMLGHAWDHEVKDFKVVYR